MSNCLACNQNIYVVPLEERLLFPKEYLDSLEAGYCSVDCFARGKTMGLKP